MSCLPTWMLGVLQQKCREIYESHGCYAYIKHTENSDSCNRVDTVQNYQIWTSINLWSLDFTVLGVQRTTHLYLEVHRKLFSHLWVVSKAKEYHKIEITFSSIGILSKRFHMHIGFCMSSQTWIKEILSFLQTLQKTNNKKIHQLIQV